MQPHSTSANRTTRKTSAASPLKLLSLLGLLSIGTLAPISCSSKSDDDGDPCTTDGDCDSGESCDDGICSDGNGGSGGSSGGGGSGGGGECKVELTNATCGKCVGESCCASAEKCLLDVGECSGLLNCMSANCSTATDVDACMNESCKNFIEKGLPPANAYLECVNDKCKDACSGESECSVELGNAACNLCMQANCCDLAEPCFTEGEACDALRACLVTKCETAPDINVCMQENCSTFVEDGLPPFNAYLMCLDTECKTECAGDSPTPMPPPEAASFALTSSRALAAAANETIRSGNTGPFRADVLERAGTLSGAGSLAPRAE